MGLWRYLRQPADSPILGGGNSKGTNIGFGIGLATLVFGPGVLLLAGAAGASILAGEAVVGTVKGLARWHRNRPPKPPKVVYVDRPLPPLTQDVLFQAALDQHQKNLALIEASPLPAPVKEAMKNEEKENLAEQLRTIMQQP